MRLSIKLVSTLVLLFIANYLSCSSSPSRIDAYKTSETKLSKFRLPKRIKPQHYELFLRPNLESPFDLEGQVKIDFQVIDDPKCDKIVSNNIFHKSFGCNKNKIILHAGERLHITDASVSLMAHGAAATPIKITELSRDKKNQFLIVKVDKKLEEGTLGQLELKFKGDLKGNPGYGVYLNEFVDPESKQTKRYASTKFEPTYARNAFPCFDEPESKATFDLMIEHQSQLTAVANMEQVKQEQVGDHKRSYFARSPKMSTYLLAFAVGEFDHLESEILDGKLKINLITRKGQSERGKFALDIARRSYASLLDYFGIDQPLKKIDLLPTKTVFPVRAMENWGLVTFDEGELLRSVDKRQQTIGWEASSALVIVHELAHHWFGNLVTMKWWDDLWLNEGFATWMSYEKANEILPEINYNIYYLQELHIPMLDDDADPGTHPVRQPNLKTTQEIDNAFDYTTYQKGSAIVRMLSDYLGKENFKLALRKYIQKHSFGNARSDDLWTVLEAETGLQVGELMKSWLDQPGFPLISVELVGTGEQKKLLVEQKRFANDKSGKQKQRWMVPITMLIGGGDEASPKVVKFVLEQTMDKMEIQLPSWFKSDQHWIKLNADFEGFFRVQYSQELLNRLREPIETRSMSPIDRINVLDDMVALFQTGQIKVEQMDEVLNWFRDENDSGVMFSFIEVIHKMYAKIKGERHLLLVDRFNKINRLSVNPTDGLLEQRERALLLTTFIYLDYEPVVKEALDFFDAKFSAGELISPVIGDAVYLAVARSGSDGQLQKLKQVLNQMEQDIKMKIIYKAFRDVDWERREKVVD